MSFADFQDFDSDVTTMTQIAFEAKIKNLVNAKLNSQGLAFWDACHTLTIRQLQDLYLCEMSNSEKCGMIDDPKCVQFRKKWRDLPDWKDFLLSHLATRARV
jgi:hypothetical protein